MTHKIIIINDPGIDGAFALALALREPQVDVLGLAATAGNVGADQANQNIHLLVAQIDPPRWPRFGAAPPVEYDIDNKGIHGPGGLGGVTFPVASPHHWHPSEKLIVDIARQYPGEIELLVLGPLTAVARAIDRDPELPGLLKGITCMGGSWRVSSHVSPVAEFHIACDPESAAKVFHCSAPLTLVPLDVTRRVLFSPTDLTEILSAETPSSNLLRQIMPVGIAATERLYGTEGLFLHDVVAFTALVHRALFTVRPMVVDVETHGRLTRGMLVVDDRWACSRKPNVDMAVAVDVDAVRRYTRQTLLGSS